MIGGLAAALLLIATAYLHTMAVDGTPGRHRETPRHPGWETNFDDLVALHSPHHHS